MSATHIAEWAEERAVELGIEIELEPADGENRLHIAWIKNLTGDREHTEALFEEMKMLADEHGVDITLDVQNGAERLVEHYQTYGFELVQDPSKHPEPRMIRRTENPQIAHSADYPVPSFTM